MAVDNLPSELPKDSSIEFGENIINHLLPYLIDRDDGRVLNATITENGYFIIINRDNGEIISSNNILKILKRKKQNTKITGFIMGSGKIYSVTLNGYLIVSSAISGKVESFKKIGDKITSNPVINDGKLYILTNNSKIIGLN